MLFRSFAVAQIDLSPQIVAFSAVTSNGPGEAPCMLLRSLFGPSAFAPFALAIALAIALAHPSASAQSANSNRLTYLDEDNPFYPGSSSPKLTTPQWIGEPGVDIVVTLGIDDMSNHARYEEYFSFPAFTTTIENYPYPYLHSGGLWGMPFVVPSDWESQQIQGNAHPQFLEDWRIALDLIASKQGIFNTIFDPANRSSPTQHVAFIDHASNKYGKRLKFLNYSPTHH